MSAVHHLGVSDTRVCQGCGEIKTIGNFAAGSPHCYACVALIERAAFLARNSGLPAWIWRLGRRGRGQGVAASSPPASASASASVAAQPPAGDQTAARLETIFSDVLLAEGFASLNSRIQNARRRVAERHRDRVDQEGWIV